MHLSSGDLVLDNRCLGGNLANFGRAPGALSASLHWRRYFHRREHNPTKPHMAVPEDSHQPTHSSASIPKSASQLLAPQKKCPSSVRDRTLVTFQSSYIYIFI